MLDLAVVLFLVVINGLFSLSELAIISARRPRLQAMAEAGRRGAQAAIDLGENPGRFLSTVQIGITLVGVLAGAFSGDALGGPVASAFVSLGVAPGLAEKLGFLLVVAFVTYLSIVVGELVPKRLALGDPEGLACRMAPMMKIVSRVSAPVVWLLDASGNLVFRLLGVKDQGEEKVTDEDLRSVVAEAERHGTIEAEERSMIAGVLRLGDRAVRAVMTPRGEVDWIDLKATPEAIRDILTTTVHSRLPVGDGSAEEMVGVVQSRELLAALLRGEELDVRALTRPAPVVPDTADALALLATLRAAEVPMALVMDEYGHFEGIVTPTDLTGAIVGEMRSDTVAGEEPAAVQREDGSWLIAGWMPADEMAERLSVRLPEDRAYETAAGYILQILGHLPKVGETTSGDGWRFEVVDLDGRRIDKVLATRVEAETAMPDLEALRPGAGAMPVHAEG